MASVFHQLNPRWAVLGSVGWQEWSKFGQLQLLFLGGFYKK
jgi:long-chain fatty acid transport protein